MTGHPHERLVKQMGVLPVRESEALLRNDGNEALHASLFNTRKTPEKVSDHSGTMPATVTAVREVTMAAQVTRCRPCRLE